MYTPSGIIRIRKPHPHDVLSGRGGGINSHVGNKAFREWVRERKEDYNLAITKLEKAEVAHEVMNLVRNQKPPGRFLQRDPTSGPGYNWWVEIDATRALAKTSQALREGAPQIRAAHKDELGEKMARARRSKRKKQTHPSHSAEAPANLQTPPPIDPPLATATTISSTVPPVHPTQAILPGTELSASKDEALRALQKNVQEAKTRADQQQQQEEASAISIMPPPLMSNKEFEDTYAIRPPKRGRFAKVLHIEEPQSHIAGDTTPPLSSVPHSQLSPMKQLDLPPPATNTMEDPSNTLASSSNDPVNRLIRSHSLALSDFTDFSQHGEELIEDFVNPFADESDAFLLDTARRSRTTPNMPSPLPQRHRVLRNLSDENTNTEQQRYHVGSNRSSQSSRYVASNKGCTTKSPAVSPPAPFGKSCFCDCDGALGNGQECICSQLADHLLHRADGLQLLLLDTFSCETDKAHD